MNELVFVENGQVVTDSLTVAEVFGKRHDSVLRDIRNLECSSDFNLHNFAEIDYTDERNRRYKKYLIKRDGLAFLVFGYTGAKAAEYKEKYIKAFNQMEEQLKQPKVLSEKEQLIATMRLSIEHEEKFQEHGARITDLETKVKEQITLNSGEQRRLQLDVAKKVYSVTEDKEEVRKLFRELYRELKNRFGVASYKDIKSHELESAIGYVNAWIPRKTA